MNHEEAQQRFQKCDQFMRAGDYASAYRILEAIQEAYPNHPEIAYQIARCQVGLKRYAEARALCRSLVQEDKSDERIDALLEEIRDAIGDDEPRERRLRLPSRRTVAGLLGVMLVVFLVYAYFLAYPRLFRIMEFPEGDGIGEIFVERGRGETLRWESRGPASGRVAIWRRAKSKLVFDETGWKKLKPAERTLLFSGFDHDAFYEIDASEVPIGDDGLIAIGRISGARVLSLRSAGIRGPGLVHLDAESSLLSLDVSQNQIEDEWVAWIGQLPNLRILDLRENPLSDEGMGSLSDTTTLEILQLPSAIGDEGVKRLQNLTALRRLELGGHPISDRALKFIANFRNLEHLDLSGTLVGDEGLSRLENFQRLRVLNLADSQLRGDTLGVIRTMGALVDLNLAGTPIATGALGALDAHPSLARLDLSRCFDSQTIGDALDSLAEMQLPAALLLNETPLADEHVDLFTGLKLAELSLENTDLSEAGLAQIGVLVPDCQIAHSTRGGTRLNFPEGPSLARIYVQHEDQSGSLHWSLAGIANGPLRVSEDAALRIELSPEGADNLPQVAAIVAGRTRELVLPDELLSDETDWSSLAQFLNLASLDTRAAGPANSLIEAITGLRELKTLSLGAPWDDAAVTLLPDTIDLRNIDLSSTNVTAAALSNLARFRGVESLDLSGRPVAGADFSMFPAIRVLVIRDSGFDANMIVALEESMPNVDIRHGLQSTRIISFPEEVSLGTVWQSSAADGGWTRVGAAQGSVAVAEGVSIRLDFTASVDVSTANLQRLSPDALNTLQITGTHITDESIEHVVHLTELHALDLLNTGITDAGVAALVAAAPGSGNARGELHLISLGLSGARISGDAIASLDAFTTLRRIDLSRTSFNSAAARRLAELPDIEWIGAEDTLIQRLTIDEIRDTRVDLDIAFRQELGDTERMATRRARNFGNVSQQPIGKIYVRSLAHPEAPWQYWGELDRAVAIPPKHESKLLLAPQDLAHHLGLRDLPADALDIVELPRGVTLAFDQCVSLSKLRFIREIHASEVRFPPNGLLALASLPFLERLELEGAHFSVDELRALRTLPSLRVLNLASTGIDDRALRHLFSATSLEDIDLHENPNVGDATAQILARLSNLRRVSFRGTSITDHGITALTGAPRIEFVDVFRTPVSGAVVLPQRVTLAKNTQQLSRLEQDDSTQRVRRAVQRNPQVTGAALAKVLGVDSLSELAPESLMRMQEAVLDAVTRSGQHITPQLLDEISGSQRVADAPDTIREPLQKAALNAMAQSGSQLTRQDLIAVAGVASDTPDAAPAWKRLVSSAVAAMVASRGEVVRDDILAVTGTRSLTDLDEETVTDVRRAALEAKVAQRSAITDRDLSNLVPQGDYQSLERRERAPVRAVALETLANSPVGIRSEDLVTLDAASSFEEIQPGSLAELQNHAMFAMAASDTGITAQGISEVGGSDHYEDLADESMGDLQTMAIGTVVDSEILLTSETLAQIGGRDDFEEVPEQRLDTLQTVGLSTMANSSTGITVVALTEIGGVDSFEDFETEALENVQTKALSAMADSDAGLSVNSLALVAGVDSVEELEAEQAARVREIAVSAMAQSATGIVPTVLTEILGDTGITVLDLSRTNITDTDLRNVPNPQGLLEVDLTGCTAVSDSGMGYLKQAGGVQVLRLASTGITDEGLLGLRGLASLRELDVSFTQVTDRGMSVLPSFPSLEIVRVEDTRISDTGLTYLASTPNIQQLNISGTRISDQGLSALPPLAQLSLLSAGRTRISDAGVSALIKYDQLESLAIPACPSVTDSGIEALAELPRVSELTLHDTSVSDDSLEALTGWGSLRYLSVNQNHFSVTAMQQLEDALPQCLVQGIGTLKDEAEEIAQLDIRAPSRTEQLFSATLNAAAATANIAFSVMMLGAIPLLLFIPFAPAYVLGIARMQESGVIGQSMQQTLTGARITGIVMDRGLRALLYAGRWILGIAIAVAVIYFTVQFASDYFEENFENRDNRYQEDGSRL